MKMTAQNKLHLPKLNAQTGQDEGGKRKAGLDVREKKKEKTTNDWMTSQIQCEWSSSGCVVSRGTAVEWV